MAVCMTPGEASPQNSEEYYIYGCYLNPLSFEMVVCNRRLIQLDWIKYQHISFHTDEFCGSSPLVHFPPGPAISPFHSSATDFRWASLWNLSTEMEKKTAFLTHYFPFINLDGSEK